MPAAITRVTSLWVFKIVKRGQRLYIVALAVILVLILHDKMLEFEVGHDCMLVYLEP